MRLSNGRRPLQLPLVVVLQVLSQRVLVEQIMDRWL